ncbi:MAG: PIN domain-containing protein [Chloroflexi bacterium]|nr:PIN domain-containing protein [Chloroflexota bacterium]
MADINARQPVIQRLTTVVSAGHQVYRCQPVYYEVVRGLITTNATSKLQHFQTVLMPLLDRVALTDADWQQAARLWASAATAGKQLADVDLLIAAVAQRLSGIVGTADDDFDVLPVKRENWRTT